MMAVANWVIAVISMSFLLPERRKTIRHRRSNPPRTRDFTVDSSRIHRSAQVYARSYRPEHSLLPEKTKTDRGGGALIQLDHNAQKEQNTRTIRTSEVDDEAVGTGR